MSYDPAVGRWTSEDPIAFEGGDANLHRYVGNDPVTRVDPSGLHDHGKYGGKLKISPGFDPGCLKITYIPEHENSDGGPIQRPLPKKPGTYPADAVLIQGQGMYKVRNGCLVRIQKNDDGKVEVVAESYWPGHAEWPRISGWLPVWPSWGVTLSPIGHGNPFHEDIPGDEGGDESKLPFP